MQGGILSLVQANHGFETIDVPVSHGSTRIVYTPGADRKSEFEGCASGEKVSRKLLSAFKCLTVSDMADDRTGESGGATPEDEGRLSGHHPYIVSSAPALVAMPNCWLDRLRRWTCCAMKMARQRGRHCYRGQGAGSGVCAGHAGTSA